MKQPNIEFKIDKRLGEIGGGLIEGTTEAERVEKWGPNWREQDMGFEKEDVILARGMSFVENIKEAHLGKRILVVSHGGFLARLFNALIPNGEFSKDIGNTSVTIMELQDERNHCHLFNCMEHLETREV